MGREMRLGERISLDGEADIHLPEHSETVSVEGYDVSPTAVALIVPVDHDVMEWVPQLFKPGNFLMVYHDKFGQKKCVLHRIFRHKGGNTKWVLSFLNKVNIRN